MSPNELSLTSVLLVFLAILLDLFVRHVGELSHMDFPPSESSDAYRRAMSELNRTAFLYGIPLASVQLLFVYLLLPSTIRVLMTSTWHWWTFDLEPTLTVLFFALSVATAVVSTLHVIKVFHLRCQLRDSSS